jgi:REP element-mobilizing transposase RayT
MPSTYLSLHYHIIFATKRREPTIATAWRGRLHEYLGGTIRGLGAFPEAIGGVADHVHLLVGLKATHCLADMMRELKKAASVWVHDEIGLATFAWQEGYAAFTVSPTSRPAIKTYIANQEAHHLRLSYRDELIAILKRAGVEYDPKYLD